MTPARPSPASRVNRENRRALPRPVAASGPAVVEALEGRRLLSGTVGGGSLTVVPPTPVPPVPPVPVGAKGYGVTLQLKAGQSFNGYLGVLIGAAAPSGDRVAASVNWGDGSPATAGVVTVTKAGHIDVGGSHTYAAAGNYAITVTVTAAPIPVPGQPTPQFIVMLGTIHSEAVVTGGAPTNSPGGVTIHETAGSAFTAAVGTFTDIAPAANLHASINWGDGTTSAGTITATGGIGVDVIQFKVAGSHTYAKAGTYPIVVTVTQSLGIVPLPVTGAATPTPIPPPVRVVAVIDSTAVVAPKAGLHLNGTLSGTLAPAPTIPDVGALYLVKGAGSAGALGAVTVTGRVQLPGFIVTGRATGTLTLTQVATASAKSAGSVTLQLTGPTEKGFGPFPSTFDYVITGGTGAFAGASGSGTIDSALGPNGLTFTFVIHSH